MSRIQVLLYAFFHTVSICGICIIYIIKFNFSIEDDFITWKEKFWPSVCEKFNIESAGEEELTRQFHLITHDPEEISPNEIFTGEIARLHSLEKQRA